MLRALLARGLEPQKVRFLGKCYSTNEGVMNAMREDGINVSQKSTEYDPHQSYDNMIEEQVTELADQVAKASQIERLTIVLDSGGHLLRRVNRHQNAIKERIVGIEQTSSGIPILETEPLQFPILNVARCAPKLEVESKWIANSFVQELLQTMRELPRQWQRHKLNICMPWQRIQAMRSRGIIPPLEELARAANLDENEGGRLSALIIGGGVIGSAIYERMVSLPNVYDVRQERSHISPERLIPALSAAHVVIGTTGQTSVPRELHEHLQDNTLLASASSSDREFDAAALRQQLPKSTSCHTDSSITVPSTGRTVYLLNQGFPLNFTGAAELVALERIQLTASLLMTAILDAHQFTGAKGIVAFPLNLHPLISDFLQQGGETSKNS